MEAGNNKAMREALLALKELDFNKEEDCHTFYRIIDEALALPRRNCDVGTAEEQEKRFRECCGSRCMTKCKVYEKGIALGIVNKNNYYKVGCRFVWAQMPYEEGGKDQ